MNRLLVTSTPDRFDPSYPWSLRPPNRSFSNEENKLQTCVVISSVATSIRCSKCCVRLYCKWKRFTRYGNVCRANTRHPFSFMFLETTALSKRVHYYVFGLHGLLSPRIRVDHGANKFHRNVTISASICVIYTVFSY